eukprot:m.871641 g.871641  ORF g.871641 m.871641 type:complete len:150 (-) comp23568_c0_seq51:1802-2251(-)
MMRNHGTAVVCCMMKRWLFCELVGAPPSVVESMALHWVCMLVRTMRGRVNVAQNRGNVGHDCANAGSQVTHANRRYRSTHPMNRHVAQMVWDSRHGHSPDVAPGFTQTKFANAHQNRREYYFYHPPGRCADADMRNATSRGPGTTGCGR